MTDIDWKAKYEELMVKFLQQGFDHRQTVRALGADARRYRWLRDEGFLENWALLHICDEPNRPELTDRAIDAAMEQKI